jgi:hypothetical protein
LRLGINLCVAPTPQVRHPRRVQLTLAGGVRLGAAHSARQGLLGAPRPCENGHAALVLRQAVPGLARIASEPGGSSRGLEQITSCAGQYLARLC